MEKPSAQTQAEDRASLQKHKDRHKFLRNPRFLLPNAQRGGKSLIMPGKRPENVAKGRKNTGRERCACAFDLICDKIILRKTLDIDLFDHNFYNLYNWLV